MSSIGCGCGQDGGCGYVAVVFAQTKVNTETESRLEAPKAILVCAYSPHVHVRVRLPEFSASTGGGGGGGRRRRRAKCCGRLHLVFVCLMCVYVSTPNFCVDVDFLLLCVLKEEKERKKERQKSCKSRNDVLFCNLPFEVFL